MIARLTGKLTDKDLNQIVVDVHGVGYRVFISANCFYSLPEPPQEVSLLVHTVVREDAFHLYGFLTELERKLFTMLISVSGVGPKAALAMLSGFAAPDLLARIAGGEVSALTKAPGIGKKTAERIVVDLADKAAALAQETRVDVSAHRPKTGVDHDAISALLNLGFKDSAAEQAVAQARAELGDQSSLEAIIRLALKKMMKG